jgi:hypothetical protein
MNIQNTLEIEHKINNYLFILCWHIFDEGCLFHVSEEYYILYITNRLNVVNQARFRLVSIQIWSFLCKVTCRPT